MRPVEDPRIHSGSVFIGVHLWPLFSEQGWRTPGMEITREPSGDAIAVKVKGRLDAYWADQLSRALEEVLYEGHDRVRLDLADVSFMSSAGIVVLLRLHKQLTKIRGTLTVAPASEAVRAVLELSGLSALLAGAEPTPAAPAPATAADRVERDGVTFEVFESAPGARLRCTVVGDPALLRRGGFGVGHSRRVAFPADRFGLGLGAFGGSFAECQAHFGEFVAVAGAAAHLPGNGANVPDTLLAAGGMAPEVNVLYGLTCDGTPSRCLRFVASAGHGAIGLTELAGAGLDIAGEATVGMVVVAESAGLVGAALNRAPTIAGATEDPLGFPQVRDWMTFTAERTYVRNLALVVGVASRAAPSHLQPLLRPLRDGARLGHFHAAVLSFRPLPRGSLDLGATVAMLFEAESPLALLHLVADDRPVIGSGESEFARGVCWVGPIGDVAVGV